jgi:hypothetical protein
MSAFIFDQRLNRYTAALADRTWHSSPAIIDPKQSLIATNNSPLALSQFDMSDV